jgi:hypothetical protein
MNRLKLLRDIEQSIYGHDIRAGMNELERSYAALTKLFLPEYNAQGVPAFKGLREAYMHFTGDKDFSGQFNRVNLTPEMRSCQDVDSSSFTNAFQNAMALYLSKAYRRYPYREEALISTKRPVSDLRTVHAVQYDYPADLPTVDPETTNWPRLGPGADTEVQYNITQKGGILFVSRKAFMNNSIGLLQDILGKIGRAARRTHARYVWNFFINNSTCMDGAAWFTPGHGNLGNTALGIVPLTAAITALANMTEPGSAETIGFDLASLNWYLVTPVGMWATAVQTNQNESYFTGNDLTTKTANPCCELFGENNERVITCPFMTDVNDWGVLRDPTDVPIVEMSYLDGKEEPDVQFVADNEIAFCSDAYAYKCTHAYGGSIIDYRGGYKAVVAG